MAEHAFGQRVRLNSVKQFSSPVMRRASISEVLDCISLLATLTQSSMRAHGVPDFQAQVPQGVKRAVHQLGQRRARLPSDTMSLSCRNMMSMSLCGFNSARP
jgi:hypothetical protein